MTSAVAPLVLLVSIAGILWFSRGLGVLDTIAMLVCGAAAGASLAALAARRKRRR